MDIIVGIVIGVALYALIQIIIKARKRRKIRLRNKVADAPVYGVSANADKEQRWALASNLRQKLANAESREEYTALLDEIENSRSALEYTDYTKLVKAANHSIQRIDVQAMAEPKLQKLRALKAADENELFRELHRITIGQDGIVTYDELNNYGEKGEVEWFEQTYDKLLIKHLRELLLTAREGTVADYQRVTALCEELDDFMSNEGEEIQEFIEEHLAQEWNEMVVRFKREPDSDEDLLGVYGIKDEDFPKIIRMAREGDLLSIHLSIILAEDSDEFTEALATTILDEIKLTLASEQLALGFKPREQERSA